MNTDKEPHRFDARWDHYPLCRQCRFRHGAHFDKSEPCFGGKCTATPSKFQKRIEDIACPSCGEKRLRPLIRGLDRPTYDVRVRCIECGESTIVQRKGKHE